MERVGGRLVAASPGRRAHVVMSFPVPAETAVLAGERAARR
jgi:hypothetical protein